MMNDSLLAQILPTLNEVDRIAGISDAVIRNLQITQCYFELSTALSTRIGSEANWCTFATWASKQAGQSIRQEDLQRILERALQETPEPSQATEGLLQPAQLRGSFNSPEETQTALLEALDLPTAASLASQAVGRGNLKVFAEIGRLFASFIAKFLSDTQPDLDKLDRFCAELHPGDPPDGQEYLRRAFPRYYRAFFTQDARQRAELLLCANLEIGFHEQTRLQPEIAEALDAPSGSASQFTRRFIAGSFPMTSWLTVYTWLLRRWLGRPSALDQAAQAWLAAAQQQIRQALTETLMTISLPPNLLVRLGADLNASFPDVLRQLSNPELIALLAKIDPTPDSTYGSGARDWANLSERLHFIADLFRCYQEWQALFEAPFTPQQVADLKSGRLPAGQL